MFRSSDRKTPSARISTMFNPSNCSYSVTYMYVHGVLSIIDRGVTYWLSASMTTTCNTCDTGDTGTCLHITFFINQVLLIQIHWTQISTPPYPPEFLSIVWDVSFDTAAQSVKNHIHLQITVRILIYAHNKFVANNFILLYMHFLLQHIELSL